MRLDNMVLYQTPSFGGFKAGLGYSFSADDTVSDEKQRGFETNNNNRVLTAGVQYVNGPLNLAAAYDRLIRPRTSRAAARKTRRSSRTSWAAPMTSKW